jgi:hypothetical protein
MAMTNSIDLLISNSSNETLKEVAQKVKDGIRITDAECLVLFVHWPISSGKNFMETRPISTVISILNPPMYACLAANSALIPDCTHTRRKAGN